MFIIARYQVINRYPTLPIFTELDIPLPYCYLIIIGIIMEKNMEEGSSPTNITHSEFKGDFTEKLGPVKTEVGNIIGIEVTDEQNRKVLRKIDRW